MTDENGNVIRPAILHWYAGGMSQTEIGESLGITRSAVCHIIKRSMRKIILHAFTESEKGDPLLFDSIVSGTVPEDGEEGEDIQPLISMLHAHLKKMLYGFQQQAS